MRAHQEVGCADCGNTLLVEDVVATLDREEGCDEDVVVGEPEGRHVASADVLFAVHPSIARPVTYEIASPKRATRAECLDDSPCFDIASNDEQDLLPPGWQRVDL